MQNISLFLEKITKDLNNNKNYKNLQENYYEKIKLIENYLIESKTSIELENDFPLKINKNDENSIKYRNEGNIFFRQKEYVSALQMYNKSICFAQSNSENISIGYANRSAVLYNLKLYKECLDNIKLARAANLPKRLNEKVLKRENDCNEELLKNCDKLEKKLFQLTENAHPDVPFMIDCIDINDTADMGQGIFTKKCLRPGSVILIEKVFSCAITEQLKYSRCANCCRENFFTLIPCADCTSSMFCSIKCQTEACLNHHKYECSIIDFLFKFFPPAYMEYILALRTTLKFIKSFDNFQESIEFSKVNLCQSQTYKRTYENYRIFSDKNGSKVIPGLFKRSNILDENSTEILVLLAIIKYVLCVKSSFKDVLNNISYEEEYLTKMLIQNYIIVCSNAFHYKSQVSYLFGFGSHFNHSCSANVKYFLKGDVGYYFVLRPVEENEQLFVSYGQDFRDTNKEQRQNVLLKLWNFKCKCRACDKNYPTSREAALKYQNNILSTIYSGQFEDILKKINKDGKNEKKYYEIFKNCCGFISKYSDFYPEGPIIHIETELSYFLRLLVEENQIHEIIKTI